MRQIPVMEQKFPPTPIQYLKDCVPGNEIYIKRDDLLPFSFGGNKVRKARFFYQEIKRENPDVIMTYGSGASNHCRIIANMACAMGLECHIISPEENYEETANSRMVEAFGATVEKAELSRISETIENRKKAFLKQGKKPYFIVGGGHGNPGTAAYAECYEEICRQEEESGRFDYIFHTSGTGATQAGLVAGMLLAGRQDGQKIVGISNARTEERGRQVVFDSIREYRESEFVTEKQAALLTDEAIDKNLYFTDRYRLEGYGTYNPEVEKTIRDMMLSFGIPMDTTYVGKTFWGMKQYLKDNQVSGKRILFLHTGGTPLFFTGGCIL